MQILWELGNSKTTTPFQLTKIGIPLLILWSIVFLPFEFSRGSENNLGASEPNIPPREYMDRIRCALILTTTPLIEGLNSGFPNLRVDRNHFPGVQLQTSQQFPPKYISESAFFRDPLLKFRSRGLFDILKPNLSGVNFLSELRASGLQAVGVLLTAEELRAYIKHRVLHHSIYTNIDTGRDRTLHRLIPFFKEHFDKYIHIPSEHFLVLLDLSVLLGPLQISKPSPWNPNQGIFQSLRREDLRPYIDTVKPPNSGTTSLKILAASDINAQIGSSEFIFSDAMIPIDALRGIFAPSSTGEVLKVNKLIRSSGLFQPKKNRQFINTSGILSILEALLPQKPVYYAIAERPRLSDFFDPIRPWNTEELSGFKVDTKVVEGSLLEPLLSHWPLFWTTLVGSELSISYEADFGDPSSTTRQIQGEILAVEANSEPGITLLILDQRTQEALPVSISAKTEMSSDPRRFRSFHLSYRTRSTHFRTTKLSPKDIIDPAWNDFAWRLLTDPGLSPGYKYYIIEPDPESP